MLIALWLLSGACAIELAGRSMARTSLVSVLLGRDVSALAITVLALAATLVGLLPAWKRLTESRRALMLLPLAMSCGLAAQLSLGARLQSDGFYYFAHMRSLWFDHDQDLTNDYRLLGQGDKAQLFVATPTGYAQSAWTIGPALAWSPFFGAGHLVATVLVRAGNEVTLDGTSFPYRQAVCVASLFYGLIGLWWSYRLAERFSSARVAVIATATVACGSFVLWYLVKEPTMTHAAALAGAAGFVLLWDRTRERRTPWHWLLLGLVAGFVATIRWQSVLLVLLPLSDWLVLAVRAWRHERPALMPTFRHGILFALGGVAGFLPQMMAWQAIYGSWLAISPIGPAMKVGEPQLMAILFSARNGLFSTSPVLYFAAIGLAVVAWSRPAFGIPVLLFSIAMWWLNASVQDWWGSAAFGMRRFDSLIPLFIVGAGRAYTLVVAATRRWPLGPVVGVGALFVLWNLTFMSASLSGKFPVGETISFEKLAGEQAATVERWVGHPFSYPANLLFAWRNGLSTTEYDLLGHEGYLGDPSRPLGRIDIGTPEDEGILLRDGWHGPEGESPVTFRWARQEAELLLPLARTANLGLQVDARAFQYAGGPLQRVTVVVNGTPFGPVGVPAEWAGVTVDTPAAVWRRGINHVRLQFDWQERPIDVGMGADTRPMSAQINVFRFRILPEPSR